MEWYVIFRITLRDNIKKLEYLRHEFCKVDFFFNSDYETE